MTGVGTVRFLKFSKADLHTTQPLGNLKGLQKCVAGGTLSIFSSQS